MITVFHKDFFSYNRSGENNSSSFGKGRESIDDRMSFEGTHPRTAAEAKGHVMLGLNNRNTTRHGIDFNEDGRIIYRFEDGPFGTSNAELPSSINDDDVHYDLANIFACNGLFSRRNDRVTFNNEGRFVGDDGGFPGMPTDAADPPWRWDDKNDGSENQRGRFAEDPAGLVDSYFDELGDFSTTYLFNPYR